MSVSSGERFAARLRKRLAEFAPEVVIKQDRILLEGGVGWWKQITDAIDSVEAPDSELRFSALPKWMSDSHFCALAGADEVVAGDSAGRLYLLRLEMKS